MKSLRIKLAAIAVAIVALVAAPAAANAYTPSPQGGATVTLAPGQSGTYTFQNFVPGEVVTFSLTGENANGATLALVKTAVETKTTTKTASAEGTAPVTVTLPSNATGTYTLSASGATSGAASAAITITAGGQVPAATGVDSASLMGVWIGGGVLLLGGLAITVFAVRRQRQDV